MQTQGPLLSSEESTLDILKDIAACLSTHFDYDTNCKVLQKMLTAPVDVLHHKTIVNFMESLLSKTEVVGVRNLILNLLIRYVTSPLNLVSTCSMFSLFHLLERPEFLEVWPWIAASTDYEIRIVSVKVFQKLLKGIGGCSSEEIDTIAHVC